MVELMIIFTLGYFAGGATALVLLACTLAARNESAGARRPRRTTTHS